MRACKVVKLNIFIKERLFVKLRLITTTQLLFLKCYIGDTHRLMYKKSLSLVIYLSSFVDFSKQLRQGMPYKAANCHAVPNDQYFLTYYFLDIYSWVFKIQVSFKTKHFKASGPNLRHSGLWVIGAHNRSQWLTVAQSES